MFTIVICDEIPYYIIPPIGYSTSRGMYRPDKNIIYLRRKDYTIITYFHEIVHYFINLFLFGELCRKKWDLYTFDMKKKYFKMLYFKDCMNFYYDKFWGKTISRLRSKSKY